MASEIGFVKSIEGAVKVIGADGIEKVVVVGEAIHENDVVITGAAGSATLSLENGHTVEIGAHEKLSLDSSVSADVVADDSVVGDVAALQAALLAGEELEATAAGISGGGGSASGLSDGAVYDIRTDDRGEVLANQTPDAFGSDFPETDINTLLEPELVVPEPVAPAPVTPAPVAPAPVAPPPVAPPPAAENVGPVATANTNAISEDDVASVNGNMLTDDDGFNVDSDLDGDTLTVTAVDPTGANQYGTFTLDNADGSYTYVLDNSNAIVQALDDGETLTEVYTYTVSDGDLTDTATVTITVNGVTDGPPTIVITDEDLEVTGSPSAAITTEPYVPVIEESTFPLTSATLIPASAPVTVVASAPSVSAPAPSVMTLPVAVASPSSIASVSSFAKGSVSMI